MVRFLMFVCLAATVGCKGEPAKYALRGSGLKVRDAVTERNTETLRARIEVANGGEVILMDQTLESSRGVVWTVTAVNGSASTGINANFTELRDHNRILRDGKAVVDDGGDSPLRNVILNCTRSGAGAVWAKTLPSYERLRLNNAGVDPDEAQTVLSALEVWDTRDELFPPEKVPVGHKWTRTDSELRTLLGGQIIKITGKAEFTLVEVTGKPGEQSARVAYTVEAKGTMIMQDLGESEFSLGGTGTLTRSLAYGITLSESSELQLTATGDLVEGGRRLRTKVTGTITATNTATLFREPVTSTPTTASFDPRFEYRPVPGNPLTRAPNPNVPPAGATPVKPFVPATPKPGLDPRLLKLLTRGRG